MSSIKGDKVNQIQRLAAIQAGRKIDIPENPGDNEEYINILQEFMEQSAEQCKFLEAETARIRIEEMKEILNKGKSQDLKSRHHDEKQDLEKEHQNEIDKFNSFWEEKMEEYNNESENMEKQLIEKHQEELEMLRQQLEEGLPQQPKDSNKLLSLKNQRDFLSRQKQYVDAHIVHVEIEKLEQQEQENYQQERAHKIRTQLNIQSSKQNQELANLRLKIQKGREEQMKNRVIEEERLHLNYKKVVQDTGNRQTNENNILKKTFANPGMNQSRYMTQSKFNQSRSGFKG